MTETIIQPQLEDAEIILGLRSGDAAAWTALYDKYSVGIWRYVARLIGNRNDAIGEVVQETFLSAAQSARAFDDSRGTLWSWLTGIAHRQSALFWRREKKAARTRDEPAANPSSLATPSSTDPALQLEHRELTECVRHILTRLPAEYSMLLTAKYLDGHSIERIQKLCGGTADSVRSKLKRARADFRDHFERIRSGEVL